MRKIDERFYKGRAVLNVLANSIENAKEVYEAADGHVIVGVLSKNYSTAEEAVQAMKEYGKHINDAVSIGLGAGDNRQAAVVAQIAKHYGGSHINQVFPAVGHTRANLGTEDSWVNALVSPTGQTGLVNISTGPFSAAEADQAIVPIRSAIGLVKDMGGNAIKYFPMGGLTREQEYIAVAQACAEAGFALEPTGGIDMDNFSKILEIALQAKVPQIIPHVYSSIIDADTGATNIEQVRELTRIMKQLVDQYE